MESSPAKRIETVIETVFNGNGRSLAASLGVHESQISRWINEKNGVSDITAKKFEPIGINPAWILFGEGEMFASNDNGFSLRKQFLPAEDFDSSEMTTKYKFFRNPVGAGANPDFDSSFDMINFNDLLHLSSTSYIAPVTGEQFAEFGIHEGDLIVVEKTAFVKDYALVIVKIGSDTEIRRYRKYSGREFLTGENPELQPITFTNDISIIGVISNLIKRM